MLSEAKHLYASTEILQSQRMALKTAQLLQNDIIEIS